MSDACDGNDGDDELLTPEEREDAERSSQKLVDLWEAEATETYGPPELRVRKNQRYARRLIRKYSEETIRGILKALSVMEEPTCCSRLRDCNLDEEPLEEIIRPFEIFGLHFRISEASEMQFTVDIGQSYDTVGSGGQFEIERDGDGSFRVVRTPGFWIA